MPLLAPDVVNMLIATCVPSMFEAIAIALPQPDQVAYPSVVHQAANRLLSASVYAASMFVGIAITARVLIVAPWVARLLAISHTFLLGAYYAMVPLTAAGVRTLPSYALLLCHFPAVYAVGFLTQHVVPLLAAAVVRSVPGQATLQDLLRFAIAAARDWTGRLLPDSVLQLLRREDAIVTWASSVVKVRRRGGGGDGGGGRRGMRCNGTRRRLRRFWCTAFWRAP